MIELIRNKFTHGDKVFIVHDEDQVPRMVTAIMLLPGGVVKYEVSSGPNSSYHYELELSAEPTLLWPTLT